MEVNAVTVVHIVRKANGPEPIREFLDAYWEYTSPKDADLVLACKGFDGVDDAPCPCIPGVTNLMLPDVGYDLGTYRRAAEMVGGDFVCFLNSFSRPLVRDWLNIMMGAAHLPLVGIVGCTGSWEGSAGAPFPNPHVRTNAFVMRRELFLSLDLPEPLTKEDANALEAGPNNITRQIVQRGLKAVVVNRKNQVGMPDCWHQLGTFRSAGGSELLVADNRTDDYAKAPKEEQRYLRMLAWGDA